MGVLFGSKECVYWFPTNLINLAKEGKIEECFVKSDLEFLFKLIEYD